VQDVDGGLAWVLVLVEPLAGRERDDGLPERVLMSAVHGVRCAATGGGLGEVQLLARQGGQGRLLHGGCLCFLLVGVDGLSVAEELMVLVVATVAAADRAVVADELHALDPLDLLEAELVLIAPERCAMEGSSPGPACTSRSWSGGATGPGSWTAGGS